MSDLSAISASIDASAADLNALTIDLMMRAAIRECIDEGRADPKAPLVCPLNRYRPLASRDVPQKWRDEAAEHLAVRRAA